MAQREHVYTFFDFGQTISTILTPHPDVVRQWIDGVNADESTILHYIGFEIELDEHTSRIGTIQFYYGERGVVFQVGDTWPCPLFLDQFLSHPANTFVGSDIRNKIDLLRFLFPFNAVMLCRDLGDNNPFLRYEKRSVLAAHALGLVEFDWDRKPYELSIMQLHYACLSAFLNLHMAKTLWNIN